MKFVASGERAAPGFLTEKQEIGCMPVIAMLAMVLFVAGCSKFCLKEKKSKAHTLQEGLFALYGF